MITLLYRVCEKMRRVGMSSLEIYVARVKILMVGIKGSTLGWNENTGIRISIDIIIPIGGHFMWDKLPAIFSPKYHRI